MSKPLSVSESMRAMAKPYASADCLQRSVMPLCVACAALYGLTLRFDTPPAAKIDNWRLGCSECGYRRRTPMYPLTGYERHNVPDQRPGANT